MPIYAIGRIKGVICKKSKTQCTVQGIERKIGGYLQKGCLQPPAVTAARTRVAVGRRRGAARARPCGRWQRGPDEGSLVRSREGGLPPWVLDPVGGLVMADGEGAQATPRRATGDAPVILALGEEVEEVRGREGKSTHMMGMMEEDEATQSTCAP